MGGITRPLFPDDLKCANQICTSGRGDLSCSVIWPGHQETFGAVGIILTPRTTASITSVSPTDWALRFRIILAGAREWVPPSHDVLSRKPSLKLPATMNGLFSTRIPSVFLLIYDSQLKLRRKFKPKTYLAMTLRWASRTL